MKPKYEEKTYENYFNTELSQRSSVYFPFGQIQEGSIGADSSAYSENQALWSYLGYPQELGEMLGGVELPEIAHHMNEKLKTEINNIPRIKANLFFQYKRPEVIKTSKGSEWHHWKQKYYRYNIYKEQQEILEEIAKVFGDRALVIYASPAIETVDDLVAAMINREIIETTNFRPAIDLSKHHRNTYIKSGTHSIACSEPEQLENFNLLTQIQMLHANRQQSKADDVVRLSRDIQKIVKKTDIGNAFHKKMETYRERYSKTPTLFALISMGVFRELSGIQWTMVTENRNPSPKRFLLRKRPNSTEPNF
ncbi:hypothetical protein ACOXVJ_23820 [Pseudomonas knackmussii]|uniref:hypothetical protein n=1 Tax=Pseudomonas knackmussii TaxID=65741 RepID=UPI003BBE75F8